MTTTATTRYTSKDARRVAEVLYDRMGVELPRNTRLQIITTLAASLYMDVPASQFHDLVDHAECGPLSVCCGDVRDHGAVR